MSEKPLTDALIIDRLRGAMPPAAGLRDLADWFDEQHTKTTVAQDALRRWADGVELALSSTEKRLPKPLTSVEIDCLSASADTIVADAAGDFRLGKILQCVLVERQEMIKVLTELHEAAKEKTNEC